jgi:hypothetical protein
MDDGAISLIGLRKMSEVEQSVRDKTGIPFQKVAPHPEDFKKDGSDGRDHVFGKSTVRAKPNKKKPTGGVKYIKTVPLAKRDDDVEQIDVFFGFKGNYIAKRVPSDLTYRFKSMFCRDREDAVWTKCDRTDSADEEWVLFGQELSDADITRIMEDRWLTPLERVHTIRPMENNQVLHLTRRGIIKFDMSVKYLVEI